MGARAIIVRAIVFIAIATGLLVLGLEEVVVQTDGAERVSREP